MPLHETKIAVDFLSFYLLHMAESDEIIVYYFSIGCNFYILQSSSFSCKTNLLKNLEKPTVSIYLYVIEARQT